MCGAITGWLSAVRSNAHERPYAISTPPAVPERWITRSSPKPTPVSSIGWPWVKVRDESDASEPATATDSSRLSMSA